MFAAHLKRILMLLFLAGVLSSDWRVDYQNQNICAVRGSSVTISCLFHYPEEENVQSVKWGHERNDIYYGPFIYDSLLKNDNRSSRFHYIGDKKHNCSFQILHVRYNDTGKYVFRFITNSAKGQFTGLGGSTLKVVDLKILMTNEKKTFKEGDSVNLTCICCDSDHSSEFIWVKNGRAIHKGQMLYLGNMSSTSSGNYVCSLKGHTGTASGAKRIDVEYGPRNTSVSVTSSAEINTGSKITLLCSSLANPPVENYTWFKMYKDYITAVGNKPEHHIMEIHQRDYGQYFCSAANKHGSQNSSVVALKVKEFMATFNRNVLIVVTFVATLVAATILVCIRRLCKKKSKPPETDCEVDTQDFHKEDSLFNLCVIYDQNPINANWINKDRTQEERHEGELIYAAVTIRRKTDMVKKMDSPNDDDECVIYSTVCRT